MNTKSLLIKGAVVIGGLGLLGGLGATAASASVRPPAGPVVASTLEINVPDTTSGTATSVSTPFGPVWAWDNVIKTFRVTPLGDGQYTVTETVNGIFTAFDEPNTPDGTMVALSPAVTGLMHGTNTYTVTSGNAPDAAGLPRLVNDQQGNANNGNGYSTSDLITDIFGGSAQVGGGNNWVFAYHAAHSSMTQAWNTPTTAWGNITG
jgi:hypothetical protein